MRRPFWQQPLVWLWDHIFETPLVDMADVPARSPYYRTNLAYNRLVYEKLIEGPPQSTDLEEKARLACKLRKQSREPEEYIQKAYNEGRLTDYDRLRLFAPIGSKHVCLCGTC